MVKEVTALATSEVAARFGVTTETVRRWVREKRLTAWKTAAGFHLFPLQEVARFEKERGAYRESLG